MASAAAALKRLADLTEAETKATKAADRARLARDRQVLKAYEAGNGYAALAATIHKTDDRVGQILKEQRKTQT